MLDSVSNAYRMPTWVGHSCVLYIFASSSSSDLLPGQAPKFSEAHLDRGLTIYIWLGSRVLLLGTYVVFYSCIYVEGDRVTIWNSIPSKNK
ncbi:hypothetical protein B0T26DRAFT_350921 [Lasiosphaeria miniovina]|uniref:Uncharacterized protein n=1 Tax=Lasiosphaeria miniovina TaxID=1954250 RepID=A0AA40ABS6_9PEZI|nr:uncharacterized protein B0T26DRAFT_350921 [Lasiosphaeria miniovina]KAK0712995.1 hypothetical protein B0T26DRAFT_350921 [Lasiosphaeria miniovina]